MILIRPSFGFICTRETIKSVQTKPMPEEQVVIDSYMATYKQAIGFAPHGLHYLPFPGVDETVAVWIPIEEYD